MRPTPVLLALVAALAAASPAAAATRECGRVNGGFETAIKANGVGCKTALDVVRSWHRKAVGEGRGPYGVRTVGSWSCRSRSAGDPEHVNVTCKRRTSWLRFYAGP